MNLSVPTLNNVDVRERRVLVRVDLNVPIEQGRVTSDARIQAVLPTLRQLLDANASVMLLSHLGRPIEGEFSEENSLAPVAARLSELLGQSVRLEKDWLQGVTALPGEVVLCENVRFQVGEKANDPALAQKMAALCDVFVMDAFGTAHRAQASTVGVTQFAPQACAGPLLCAELDALGKALADPKRPLVAIVGGAKVSSKLTVLHALAKKVDHLIVGGGIANTFNAAAGFPVGKSLYEPDLVSDAKTLLAPEDGSADIPLPIDVVTAKAFSAEAATETKALADVADDDLILDVGPKTAAQFASLLNQAGTIVWNGPVGVFEMAPFAEGTRALASAIAGSPAFSIAGGGDTLAAVEQFGINDQVSYISTGGGAFLTFLEGKPLPAVEALKEKAQAGKISA